MPGGFLDLEARKAANDFQNVGATADGKFVRPLGKPESPTASKGPFVSNARPRLRASLVERDNDAEAVVFHYNPSSFKISKKANWSDKDAGTGPRTLEWGGPGLTVVTFDVLFDDQSHPYKSRGIRSTDDSIAWLFGRTRNRLQGSSIPGRAQPNRRVSWLNEPSELGDAEPPVLVLFGLSYPFVCRLTDVDVTTVFQGGPPFIAPPPTNTSVGELRRFEADQLKQQRGQQAFQIERATVQLTLTEYVAAPQTENKQG